MMDADDIALAVSLWKLYYIVYRKLRMYIFLVVLIGNLNFYDKSTCM